MEDSFQKAFRHYQPEPYPDPVFFVKGSGFEAFMAHSVLWEHGVMEDWRRIAPQLEVQSMDCSAHRVL